jgi:AcrR family transcriptional regulator
MPTGVALHDPRKQLFDAAERILLRDGAGALTSRAVTAEAGVAKGVLHRHFEDFDAFLAELVLDRVERLRERAAALCDGAGQGAVVSNLTTALAELFDSDVVILIGVVIARDAVRDRLRQAGLRGMPVLREATMMVSAYLAAEQEQGRVSRDASIQALAPTLIGGAHLLYADREGAAPQREAVEQLVATALADVLR